VLAHLPAPEDVRNLLVGNATNDDAAVLRLDAPATAGNQALVQTVDFFTPIVDDPFLFGAIAAANSVSDIYAMGAKPILGLAIAAFPTDKLPLTTLHEILRGGASKAAEAGFPVAGGHTIIDDVPKYGLAVTGVVAADRIVRNSTARAGDLFYLTKPIGNGILISAHRAATSRGWKRFFRRAEAPPLDRAIEWMTMLNRDAAAVMVEVGVSAATDVTGYGLIGHLHEMCAGSGVGAQLRMRDVPLLDGASEYLARGFRPEGTMRNVATFRKHVTGKVSEAMLTLACDAQTSGGLLIAVPPEKRETFESAFRRGGLFYANVGVATEQSGIIELIP
jgi:selenide,water dikinase